MPQAPKSKSDHGETEPDHDAESEEKDDDIGPVRSRPVRKSFHLSVPGMRENEAAEMRDRDGVPGLRRLHIGQAEQNERDAPVTLEMCLHGGDLRRLMLERVEAVPIAGDELER